MPRKPGYRHNEETRAKIKTTQLINRLMTHVMSKAPLLDASQVNAAKALLSKVLPDLQAIDLKGETTNTHYVVNAAPLTEEEWASEHAAED